MTPIVELSSSAAPAAAPLIGGGEMGQRIRDMDWSATPLGDYATWPEALVTLVRVLLVSRQPMFIAWGPERIFLYGDSYVEVLGAKHPSALGKRFAEVWSEIWSDIGPLVDRVFVGDPVHMDNQRLIMDRHGYPEETYFTFSLTPIPNGEGAIDGLLCIVTETTGQVMAERAEERSRTRLETALSVARLGTYEWHPSTGVVEVDARGREMFGLPLGGVIRQEDTFACIAREDADRVQIEAAAAMGIEHPSDRGNFGRTIDFNYDIVRANGSRRSIVSSGTIIEGPDGTRRLIGAFNDVTDFKRAEAQLREQNVTLEQHVEERTAERDRMWDTSPDLMLVIDFEGVFRRVNPAWTTVLGYGAEELVGHHVNEFVVPDDHHETTDAYELAAEGGVPRIENRYRHKDGSVRWISWVAAPAGNMTYATGRDITASKVQAETLRQSQAKASTYFNFSEDYLFLAQVGADGGVTFEDMNPACERVMGLSRTDVIGRPVADFVPSDSEQDITRFARHCLETRQPQTYLALREYQDGHRTIIEGRVTFVERLGGGGGLVLFSGRDVTEQRTVEDALRQSQKLEAVGQLTGGVAHDFNNLLTVIKSSTDLLKRPDLAEERRARYIAAISDTVDRAAKLTGQLLAFARRQALKPEVFDAADSVRGLTDMMQTLTGSRVLISTELPEPSCYVNADASQFDTALVNLAANARDAMGGEGRITITVRAVGAIPPNRAHPAVEGPFVAVSLNDTGTGIPAEIIERIFEPFFTTKETGKGTGLGLSQVFGFAKQSGGDITVDSTLGEGTTFTFYLPRVAAPERARATEEPDAPVDGQGTRVLVVEDNIDVGTFAVQSLSDLGYTTVLAADGIAALAELAKDADRFDVVFSDVMMPGMSGIELGQEIRRLYHDLPVVLTSGYSHVLAQNGTYGFELLHKPYSVEQLSQILRKAASWQRRKRLMSP